jgi:hypothetical protein|nr:MAG TPA: hypothetical protein [Caudoviricetes sp.]
MIIDDSIITKVGETAYATWKDAALEDLANMLCMSTLEQFTTSMTGIVSDDGIHIHLPSWYSEMWSVTPMDGPLIGYNVIYNKNDGLTPSTTYSNTVTLNETCPAGTKFLINGRHGFAKLPAPLTNILAAIIQADQSTVDQTDRITSKKIEDVSVTYATSTQTPIEHALTPYKALIDSWSICPIRPNTGGILSMPAPHHDLPWWMNEQDLGAADYAIM